MKSLGCEDIPYSLRWKEDKSVTSCGVVEEGEEFAESS